MKSYFLERAIEDARDDRIEVGIDGRHDLFESGYRPTNIEIQTYERSWMRALKRAARRLGLRNVRGYSTTYQSAHEHDTRHEVGDDETLESILWQDAHDGATIPARTEARRDRERLSKLLR